MRDNIFKKEILDYASKLDAVTNAYGKIVKSASAIVEEHDNSSTIYLITYASNIIKSTESTKDLKRLANALKDSIMKFYGYYYILESQDKRVENDNDTRSLDELLGDLNKLIGLEGVKAKVSDLIAFQTVQILREKQGLHSQKRTMHLAFTGNPGTGKTTVARIIGRIYKQIGLLSKGHFIEVSRTDLIAGYQGQTALKVKKVIDEAKGGVLFIDEAYSITENDHSDSYGRECLTELTKALEDYRNDLIVIVAGYTEPMNHFFASNPGLKSRFNTFIEFPDYSAEELLSIFVKLCEENDYHLADNVEECLRDIFQKLVTGKKENFSNARLVRNIYDDATMNLARRVVKLKNPSRDDLSLIICEDFDNIGSERNDENTINLINNQAKGN
ncbi:AAA family ATPase [Amedibacterium intestinale]|uniref:AAA family ATPase n=1 Tax=Amedibacterium intestinale TaxID=2583452 RepID=UPI000E4D74B0|nr:AAA family ATPase [Amedibacterium intestinale]RHO34357.1 AAA family ATPase [Erysipelotrichaceae bacterium AM17-60]